MHNFILILNSRGFSCYCSGTILFQPNSKGKDEAPTIQMNWKVPSASVSGLAVASLQLTNEKYKPYKGVRAVAKAGKFQIRIV